MTEITTPVRCFCLRAKAPDQREEREPGAHHAVTCPQYRSDTTGPNAAHWEAKLRELFRLREDRKIAEQIVLSGQTVRIRFGAMPSKDILITFSGQLLEKQCQDCLSALLEYWRTIGYSCEVEEA